jgi:hypothetical protein
MIDARLLPIANIPEMLPPLIAVIFVLMIPIVGILAWHQQRMAVLVRHEPQQLPQQTPNEVAALRQDIHDLKALVSSLAINMDNMKDEMRRPSDLPNRIKVGE